MAEPNSEPSIYDRAPWRRKLHDILFEADTLAGKVFDVVLIIAILISVLAVMMETVVADGGRWDRALWVAEWVFTVLFTIEYVLRLLSVQRPGRYAVSFFGIVDLISILPTYISVLAPGAQSLLVVRTLRLLRIFRVFKLARYLSEARALREALWRARAKIVVFLVTVLIVVTIIGTAMYLVEHPQNPKGFSSIPQSMYWAIVTMATVGYGDVVPVTIAGKLLASALIIIGYSMIIVPTGIISAEMASTMRKPITTQACPHCMREGHDTDAAFCKYCGEKM